MRSLAWATEMEGDVASDLSVFHRVDDMYEMGSRKWALLVPRLSAYAGVVQYRLSSWDSAAQQEPVQQTSVQQAPAAGTGEGGVALVAADGTPLLPGPPSPWDGKVIEATPAALKFSEIGDMFSFG